MNVVHLQLSGGIGGISVLTRDIALKSSNNNIFYFLFEGGEIADHLKAEGSPVQVENDKNASFVKAAKKFVAFCKKNKADVIICHTGSPITRFILFYCKKHYNKAKLILYLHSNAADTVYPNKIKQTVSRYLLKSAHNAADYCVAISKSVKQSYIDMYGFDENKCRVVYNGIDLNKFYTNRLDSVDCIFNIIYVGRIIPVKGVHLLLDAMAKNSANDNIKLTIVGNAYDDYGEKLQKQVQNLGIENKIEFTGPRLDIPDLLANADLFVHPAIWDEGFGITLAEAMASYLPCVAYNKGAIPELIDNNINGIIVDDCNAQELAAAIERLYSIKDSQEYKNMRINASKKAQLFSIEKCRDRLESLYS